MRSLVCCFRATCFLELGATVLARVTKAEAPRSFGVALSVEQSGPELFDRWPQLGDSEFLLEPLEALRARFAAPTIPPEVGPGGFEPPTPTVSR
jgi:hypothetical protein